MEQREAVDEKRKKFAVEMKTFAGHKAVGMMNRLSYSVDLRKSLRAGDTRENLPAASLLDWYDCLFTLLWPTIVIGLCPTPGLWWPFPAPLGVLSPLP